MILPWRYTNEEKQQILQLTVYKKIILEIRVSEANLSDPYDFLGLIDGS